MQPNKEKRDKTIAKRRKEEQERLLENFRKMPILQVSLDKAGIGRSTYYEWRENDEKFRNAADAAIREGELFINDFSESKLLSLVEHDHFGSIMAWLRVHHKKYATKVEIVGSMKIEDEHFTPDEAADITEALRQVGVPFEAEKSDENNHGEQPNRQAR